MKTIWTSLLAASIITACGGIKQSGSAVMELAGPSDCTKPVLKCERINPDVAATLCADAVDSNSGVLKIMIGTEASDHAIKVRDVEGGGFGYDFVDGTGKLDLVDLDSKNVAVIAELTVKGKLNAVKILCKEVKPSATK